MQYAFCATLDSLGTPAADSLGTPAALNSDLSLVFSAFLACLASAVALRNLSRLLAVLLDLPRLEPSGLAKPSMRGA
jgi:hypothetical protein